MKTKPHILVLYYSQSGQMREILDSILSGIRGPITVDYACIQPQTPFPFPWSSYSFFDAMPETVAHIPIALKPLPEAVKQQTYDLVLLGYQPWFLNPSLPVSSFLQTPEAAFLKGKKIITVIGSRNMWLHGQEKVKAYLLQLGALLVGNIALTDRTPNLISTLTVARWAFKGQKEASRFLPAAGVQAADIEAAQRFGSIIYEHLAIKDFSSLQEGLLAAGAVQLKPGLVLLEKRGIANFRKFAPYIRAQGGPGNPNRRSRVLLFKRLLLIGIFILSPISSLTAFIQLQFQKKRLLQDVRYFKHLEYAAGRI